MTSAPKSRTRASSAGKSTVLSQLAIPSLTSAPTPSTSRSCPTRARNTCSGVSNRSSNRRSRTGPRFGTMFSAMQASVSVMRHP